MDDRVIKAAIDSFESDNLVQAKELIQGQVKQARNDFIKAKLGLKNDIEQQFTRLEDNPAYNEIDADDVTPEPEPRKRRLSPIKRKVK